VSHGDEEETKMAHSNKLIGVAVAALLTLGVVGTSGTASARAADKEANNSASDQTPAYEQVDSFVMFGHPYSWSPIDDRTVVLWATAFEPYLVRIAYPSHDMHDEPRLREVRRAADSRLPLSDREYLQAHARRGAELDEPQARGDATEAACRDRAEGRGREFFAGLTQNCHGSFRGM